MSYYISVIFRGFESPTSDWNACHSGCTNPRPACRNVFYLLVNFFFISLFLSFLFTTVFHPAFRYSPFGIFPFISYLFLHHCLRISFESFFLVSFSSLSFFLTSFLLFTFFPFYSFQMRELPANPRLWYTYFVHLCERLLQISVIRCLINGVIYVWMNCIRINSFFFLPGSCILRGSWLYDKCPDGEQTVRINLILQKESDK